MISAFIEQASTYAGDIDNLINLIGWIVGVWFVVTEAVFFYFIFKFRRKDGVKAQYIEGTSKKEKNWISIPHFLVILCDIVLIVGAVKVWVNVKQRLPEPDYKVRIVSQQWAWTFYHPGVDGELGTADDIAVVDELHIESDKVYHFQLESRDVMHSFSVPVFRLKQDAIPGRVITGWFKATKTGEFDIQCAEMCGVGHGLMGARLFIESPEDHKKWMASHVRLPGPPLAAVDGQE